MIELSWRDQILRIRDPRLKIDHIDLWYIEAFCRGNSADRAWEETVIPHQTELVEASREKLHLRSMVSDGLVVDHFISAHADEVVFDLHIHNPTSAASDAQWAQPCVRVGPFTGVPEVRESEAYLAKCFVFIDGKLERMPTKSWNRVARYTPGQVWRGPGVDLRDLNPRPLNDCIPSSGLIGCYSADERLILATAWEPYQELFQGIFCCLHNDFRIAGVPAGQSKRAKGKIYLIDDGIESLLKRYRADFPQHQ